MVKRFTTGQISANLKKGQVAVLYGARRTEKTILMNIKRCPVD
jgi:hypothetical protein